MLKTETKLFCTAYQKEQFPPEKGAEIVLVGRSNSGKSTIINQLLGSAKKNTRTSARVSQTPGCTQSINFYRYRSDITLVDFPGFGYAKWPQQVRKKVTALIESYLFERQNIALIVHLVDSRHALQNLDMQMLEMVRKINTHYLLSLNKCDKLSRQNMAEKLKATKQLLKSFDYSDDIIMTSGLTGQGLSEFKTKIKHYAEVYLKQM